MTGLSEGQKLTWMGLKRAGDDQSAVQAETTRLEKTVGEFDEYQSFVDNRADLADHEETLVDEYEDWPQADAETFTTKIDNAFDTWGAYDNFINVQASTYGSMKEGFPSEVTFGGIETTGDGEVAVGIRLHDEAGVSKKGLSLPPGTIELFGQRLEVSQMGPPSVTERDLAFGEVQVNPAEPVVDEAFDVYADITNNSDTDIRVFPQLVINGVVQDQIAVDIDQGATEEARFTYTQSAVARLAVQIDSTDPVEVRVTSGDL